LELCELRIKAVPRFAYVASSLLVHAVELCGRVDSSLNFAFKIQLLDEGA
jgi:hypothetical protein